MREWVMPNAKNYPDRPSTDAHTHTHTHARTHTHIYFPSVVDAIAGTLSISRPHMIPIIPEDHRAPGGFKLITLLMAVLRRRLLSGPWGVGVVAVMVVVVVMVMVVVMVVVMVMVVMVMMMQLSATAVKFLFIQFYVR